MRRTIASSTERSISRVYDLAVDWQDRADQAIARYRGGEARGLDQRQLTQLANSAWAAGLSFLMAGRPDDAAEWLRTAAGRYRESWDAGAPPDSWGRPIAALKALLLAGSDSREAARWTLDAGAAGAESPIGRYAAALAQLVLGDDDEAGRLGGELAGREDFPQPVARALVALARADRAAYAGAAADLLASFEERDDFLEDVPVADTLLVLQVLARPRGLPARLPASRVLPRTGS
jgi:hypothetical protein